MAAPQGRTGRRPGASASSRNDILRAAREHFIRNGYKGATLRAIATDAEVDPALIRHFFGDKEGLFAATIELPPEALTTVRAVFDSAQDEWGRRLTEAFLQLWENPRTATPLLAMAASAFANDAARECFRDAIVSGLLTSVAPHLPQDRPGLRFAAAVSHLIGMVFGRHLLEVAPLVEPDVDELVNFVAPTIQRYLLGPLPESGGSSEVLRSNP